MTIFWCAYCFTIIIRTKFFLPCYFSMIYFGPSLICLVFKGALTKFFFNLKAFEVTIFFQVGYLENL